MHKKHSKIDLVPLSTRKVVAVGGNDSDYPDFQFWSPCSSNLFIFHFLIMTTEGIVPILKKWKLRLGEVTYFYQGPVCGVVVMGILKGSLASKPKFLIPLQCYWDQEIPLCSLQSASAAVLPIPRGSCFSGLSAMRGEKGEVILERYGMLLILSTSNIPRCPAQGSVNQEASLGSTPCPTALQNRSPCLPLPSCSLYLSTWP